jgi:hypothetical protein
MYYHGKGISKDDSLGNDLFRKCYPMVCLMQESLEYAFSSSFLFFLFLL